MTTIPVEPYPEPPMPVPPQPDIPPIKEPEPDRLPDEVPTPNPDENDEPPRCFRPDRVTRIFCSQKVSPRVRNARDNRSLG